MDMVKATKQYRAVGTVFVTAPDLETLTRRSKGILGILRDEVSNMDVYCGNEHLGVVAREIIYKPNVEAEQPSHTTL